MLLVWCSHCFHAEKGGMGANLEDFGYVCMLLQTFIEGSTWVCVESCLQDSNSINRCTLKNYTSLDCSLRQNSTSALFLSL